MSEEEITEAFRRLGIESARKRAELCELVRLSTNKDAQAALIQLKAATTRLEDGRNA